MLKTIPITERFEDIEKVNALAREAFPPEEYLSPSELTAMSKNSDFDFLALYDGAVFVGFMAVKLHKKMCYLFFLAIDGAFRSRGYGGQAISALKKLYAGKMQVVDFEMPDDGAENRGQREKRRLFYLRNGYRPTGHFLSYLGVDYEVFCMGESFDFELFKELMSTLRVKNFNPRYFEKTD